MVHDNNEHVFIAAQAHTELELRVYKVYLVKIFEK